MSSDVLKSRNFLIGAIVLVVVILVGSFLFLKGSVPKTALNEQAQTEAPVPTISPDELGLTLEAAPDENLVYITVENPEGIKEIKYELTYMAEDILRGTEGMINLNKKPVKVYLGSCSDVCHPDKDISKIEVVLKITKNDGNVYQSESSLDKFE